MAKGKGGTSPPLKENDPDTDRKLETYGQVHLAGGGGIGA